jgi:formylglycine-generating enzyme required for sulfatase activity
LAERAPFQPDVFLSYAREDEARAHELATALAERGWSVFWDHEVPPGQTWPSYIGEALGAAKCVVVAWSRHSIESRFVIQEAGEAADRDVLIPVLFEKVQPPFGFRDIHAANLIDWHPSQSSPAFDRLLSAVERIVGGQAGSGAEAEAPNAAQPAPAEPPPKTKSTVRPTIRPTSSDPREAPLKPPHGQASRCSGRTVTAMVAGFLALVVAGFVVWRLPQLGPVERGLSEPSVGPAASRATGQSRDVVRDCPECPDMVRVRAGEFTMGSPADEPGRDNEEGPQRTVTIAEPFWVGKYEVTFAEWDACIAAGGCSTNPGDADWGRDNRPVINVGWNDAKEYAGWLSQKTGKNYRLLSEAEWEYVARARSTTAFWWGQDVGKGNANCNGCGSEWDNTKTAPVGSFRANDFGLYDTAGNVWEWVEDCYHGNYEGAPTDGSAWLEDDCSERVIRGGSWMTNRVACVPRITARVAWAIGTTAASGSASPGPQIKS